MKYLRRLYEWILHWAQTPYGVPALFLLALAESSIFPIPPDVLLLALSMSLPFKSYYYALICSAGSLLGGVIGYGIGYLLWEGVSHFFFAYVPGFTPAGFEKVQHLFETYNFWVVFTAGFTPIPYKVITIGAGVFQINFLVFLVASALSRSLRFFLVAALIRNFGPPIRSYIEKYFNLLTIIFVVLLVGGFILVKKLM
ncbi:MAG: DedA family protein [Desulfuromonadales bacterium]|nr:DedA family protein [Desulfuromonadales bacterium]NIR33359.1 DedA family protein [Desulfuromonadales bacterium]NIS43354.1 DedA family protein [Desulfuromonadales bacterium]